MDGAQTAEPGKRLDAAWMAALVESRSRYKSLVGMCADFCWETDESGCFTFVSPDGALGYDAQDLVGRPGSGLIAEQGVPHGADPFRPVAPVDEIDLWVRRADGALCCLEVIARPFHDRSGVRRGARGLCRDVTEERERAQAFGRIQLREQMTAHIMRAMRDESVTGDMLEAAAEMLARAATSDGCAIFHFADGEERTDKPAARFGGDELPGCIAAAILEDSLCEIDQAMMFPRDAGPAMLVPTAWRGRMNGAVTVWRDEPGGEYDDDERSLIANVAVQLGVALQQIGHQRELEYLSTTDGLTGILNRRAFNRELEKRLARDAGSTGALFFIDLDNFKPVNDVHGHEKGDEALVGVSEILQGVTRPGDLVARLGGDEFAIWLDRADDAAARKRADRLIDLSQKLSSLSASPEKPLGFSIGVAVRGPDSEETLEGLTARADAAMYDVKRNGKGGAVIAPAAPEAENG